MFYHLTRNTWNLTKKANVIKIVIFFLDPLLFLVRQRVIKIYQVCEKKLRLAWTISLDEAFVVVVREKLKRFKYNKRNVWDLYSRKVIYSELISHLWSDNVLLLSTNGNYSLLILLPSVLYVLVSLLGTTHRYLWYPPQNWTASFKQRLDPYYDGWWSLCCCSLRKVYIIY